MNYENYHTKINPEENIPMLSEVMMTRILSVSAITVMNNTKVQGTLSVFKTKFDFVSNQITFSEEFDPASVNLRPIIVNVPSFFGKKKKDGFAFISKGGTSEYQFVTSEEDYSKLQRCISLLRYDLIKHGHEAEQKSQTKFRKAEKKNDFDKRITTAISNHRRYIGSCFFEELTEYIRAYSISSAPVGYSKDEVDDYLDSVANYIDKCVVGNTTTYSTDRPLSFHDEDNGYCKEEVDSFISALRVRLNENNSKIELAEERRKLQLVQNYMLAQSRFLHATTASQYAEVASMFAALGDYMDSKAKYFECIAQKEHVIERQRITEEKRKAEEEAERKRKEEEKRKAEEEAERKRKEEEKRKAEEEAERKRKEEEKRKAEEEAERKRKEEEKRKAEEEADRKRKEEEKRKAEEEAERKRKEEEKRKAEEEAERKRKEEEKRKVEEEAERKRKEEEKRKAEEEAERKHKEVEKQVNTVDSKGGNELSDSIFEIDSIESLDEEYPIEDDENTSAADIDIVAGEAFEFSSAQGVDNTGIMYGGNKRISVRLNQEDEPRNRLKENTASLSIKYPSLLSIDSGERLQTLLNVAFPDGLQKVYYIRNLSVRARERERSCGLRVKRFPGDALSAFLPDGETLLFKGHASGKEFIIDAIYDIADTDRLKFEISCTVTNYSNLELIGKNFIYDVCEIVESIAQYTADQLESWRSYLDWRIEITKSQIFGCKYYKREYDYRTGSIVFYLVCENKEVFQNFKRYLRRGIEAFNNNYSKDAWIFVPADFDPKKRFESTELGKFKDILNEYYLQDDSESSGEPSSDVLGEVKNDDYLDEEDIDEQSANSQMIGISDIKHAFDTPYIAEVAFSLNLDESSEVDESGNIEQTDREMQIQRELSRYESNGFLALSAVGEYVLINRFKRAILQVEKDDYYSPNLVEWLFNVEHARLPQPTDMPNIDVWLNPGIAANTNQRIAVQKMLAAPDICLIQGPPGTGKTTVIAEAIYQFVRQGKRVLIASQSNDAVDNALERLAETPEIRAIRLGRSSKRKRKIEEDIAQKYSEREALWYYYKSIAGHVSSTWLDKWSALEQKRDDIHNDIASIEHIASDRNVDISERNRKSNEELKAASRLRQAKNVTKQAREQNEEIASSKRNFSALVSFIEGENVETMTLQSTIIKIIGDKINRIIEDAQMRGIQLAFDTLTGNETTNEADNRNLEHCLTAVSLLRGIADKCKSAQNRSGFSAESAEYKQLIFEKKVLTKKLLQADEDDNETVSETLSRIRELTSKMKKLTESATIVELDIAETAILSNKIQRDINDGNLSNALNQITIVIDNWQRAIDKALEDVRIHLESLEYIDISKLEEDEKILQGQLDVIRGQITAIEQRIKTSNALFAEIQQKYELSEDSAEQMVKALNSLKNKNDEALRAQAIIRSQWEKTLKGFVGKLTDEDRYEYDYETFNDTYIRSCNVVGVSCTGDMRSLQERGQNDFDVAIIDEVSKATPPELLIPLMRARKAILVGDHRQLPPMFKEHESSYKEMIQQKDSTDSDHDSLLTLENFKKYEDMVTSSLFKKFFEVADESIKHSLLTQFRMHTDIMNVINRFYDGNLEQGLSPEAQAKTKSHGLNIKGIDGTSLILPLNHAYWIDSSTLPNGTPVYENRPNGSTSQMNILEIHLIMALLKKLALAYQEMGYNASKPKDIGIISFYQAQITELRKVFREQKKHFDFSSISVDINTVDRFQGKEKSIIITSLVRNNKSGNASSHIAAFERINVAFSRAQQLLIIVGAKHMYERVMVELPNMSDTGHKTLRVYNDIIQELTRKACFKTSEKLIDAADEEIIMSEMNKAGE